MPTVTPTSDEPTHHLSLSDGSNIYGFVLCDARGEKDPTAVSRSNMPRMSLKTGQGGSRYSDFEPPYIPIDQSDWSGGRGNEEFERDTTRFFDSYRMNSWHEGRLILGPQENYCTGYRSQDKNMPGSVTFQALTSTNRYLAYSFAASASYSADRAFLWVRKTGTPNGVLTVELCSDNAGDPGSVLKTATLAVATASNFESQLWVFDWTTTQALTGSTTYHIKVYGAASDAATNCWLVGVNNTTGSTKKSADNSSWSASTVDLYFRIVDADTKWKLHLYEYKGALYAVSQPDANSAAKIYLNGDRGAGTGASAAGTLVDTSKSWTTNEWADCVAKIVSGTGKGQYRTVASNTATTLTLSSNWDVTPIANDSEYVILASNKWTEITGHGLTVAVTDVLPINDIAYFAQGDGTAMRRGQETNSAGTWTRAWAADSTNKAAFLQYTNHPIDGIQVWKANNTDAAAKSVARASVAAWGTDLSFGTAIPVGDRRDLITGLERYGSPEELWPMKEGSVWHIVADAAEAIPLREMEGVKSEHTGKAHLVHGVYLYFSLLYSLERYFRNNLDDMGPGQDAGLPSDRQGPIVALAGYPGMFFVAVDAGDNYSSILLWNQLGWHELYRAPKGERIRNMYFQVIPGSTLDRLWINQGMDLIWLGFPSNTTDPYRDSNYRYIHEGTLTTAWIYANMQAVPKFFKSLRMFTEDVTASAQVVEAEYQLDGSSTWVAINGTFDTVPTEEVNISSGNTIQGKRIRFRLRLNTNDNTKTPRVKATVLETVARLPAKRSWNITVRLADTNIDIYGDEDSYTAVETIETQIQSWMSSALPLTSRWIYSPFDNATVFIDGFAMRPYSWVANDIERHIAQLTLIEA